MKRNHGPRPVRAFTLIELLVVIAIIAILAAILFPIFATVRESARQSSTMSNMHSVYLGARLFYEDEGRYPSSLFGYAETPSGQTASPTTPPAYAAFSTTQNIIPMDQATGNYDTVSSIAATGRAAGSVRSKTIYREQVKDFNTFINPLNPASHQQNGKAQVTTVLYPATLPTLADGRNVAGTMVTWNGVAPAGTCPLTPDADLPSVPSIDAMTSPPFYSGKPKIYYKMDSMDIGPKIDYTNGQAVKDANGNPVYELHYSPDWTKEQYDPANGCDEVNVGGTKQTITAQLKYKNPPTERTVLTYITDHVAFSSSNNVLILLMSGTARTVDYKKALDPGSTYSLPLNYH